MKFVRDKAHCKYESYTKEEIDKVTIIANKDLTEVIESSYFVLGEGVTDNYKNAEGVYVPIAKGTTLINTTNESTANQNVNGTITKIEVYNVNQIIINGQNLYYRSFQLLKSDLSLRENSMSSWNYKSLVSIPDLVNNYITIEGEITVGTNTQIEYPDGWNQGNSIIISYFCNQTHFNQDFEIVGTDSKLVLFYNPSGVAGAFPYKITLMKIY